MCVDQRCEGCICVCVRVCKRKKKSKKKMRLKFLIYHKVNRKSGYRPNIFYTLFTRSETKQNRNSFFLFHSLKSLWISAEPTERECWNAKIRNREYEQRLEKWTFMTFKCAHLRFFAGLFSSSKSHKKPFYLIPAFMEF